MQTVSFICDAVEQDREKYIELAKEIWRYAELCFEEKQSAAALCQVLEDEGFRVQKNAAGLSTAFVAEAGQGAPVIGFLGEYDALDGLSQEADVARREPLVEGGPGHGCGHHALGVGALAGAIAAWRYLRSSGLTGTVRYYGCPAEEGGGGKVLMASAGLFNDCTAALTWHPTCYNSIWSCNFLATRTITFAFEGFAAHSTMQPQLGRSALEAVELTSVGANYLRGHVERDVFINGAVLDAGPTAPNIIPAYAAVRYLLRAPTQRQVHETALRLYDVARGAALMSGTKLTITVDAGLSELVANRTLEKLAHKSFSQVGVAPVSQEDLDFALAIQKTLPPGAEESTFANLRYLYRDRANEIIEAIRGKRVEEILYPYVAMDHPKFGSTDVCDVSWFTPTVQVTAACYAKDTPGHSWQIVAQGKRALCMNAMLTAGKVLALTAARLFESPQEVAAVREEFSRAMQGKIYLCPIPQERVFH